MTLCVQVLASNYTFYWFLAENLRGLPAASGGPAAGGNRDMWPAGPRAEVHHLGYNPPLQRPSAFQQGTGTLTGQSTDGQCLTVTHTVLRGSSNSFLWGIRKKAQCLFFILNLLCKPLTSSYLNSVKGIVMPAVLAHVKRLKM